MGKKIKLSHKEVEVKVFLEILAVYFVLAAALVGVYYLGQKITGFATVTKVFNYSDDVNLVFNESGEYVWTLANPGNLKSIKIDGSMTGSGNARVYIEHNNERRLIFDSTKLVEKPSGMFGVTGFVAKGDNGDGKDSDKGDGNGDDKKEEDSRESNESSKGKDPNHPPVWNSTEDEFILNESLTLNLNNYFNDQDNDSLAYSASELRTNDLEILLENEILTVSNKNNLEGDRTMEITASDNETSKKKNVVFVLINKEAINETPPINETLANETLINETIVNETIIDEIEINETLANETPINETLIINETLVNETIINETITNETAEKAVGINLAYGSSEAYDKNNDGIESLTGVIDFSVGSTTFNWNANNDKLCTRYEIYSIENEESTFVCFGSNDCCSLADMQSSRDSWNESLFLSYGSYGSTANNMVFAQVIYADYNLSADEPYSDIAYSSWKNLTAKFTEGLVEFEDVCIESCLFDGNASSYKLIIEVEDSKLSIGKIKYIIEKETVEREPALLKEIGNISILKDDEYVLDLSQYFSDPDSDAMEYGYYKADNLTIRFEGNLAYITPDKGFTGSIFTYITANDSYYMVASNVFEINVNEAEMLSLDILEATEKEGNLTVRIKTSGIGNLTISMANGTYAELYNDNDSTIGNLEILGLRCGNFEIFDKQNLIETDNIWFALANSSKVKLSEIIHESAPIKSVYVENYTCSGEGYYTARVLIGGKNSQQFNFSGLIKTASAGFGEEMGQFFEIRNKEDAKLAVFDSFGNVNIKGNLTQNISLEPDADDFIIQNLNGSAVLAIKNPEGNMQLMGILNENQGILAPEPNSYTIQNKKGETVAYASENGSLFLRGTLRQGALLNK